MKVLSGRKQVAVSAIRQKSAGIFRHGAAFVFSFILASDDFLAGLGPGFLAGIEYRLFPASFLGFAVRSALNGNIYDNSAYMAAAGVITAARWLAPTRIKESLSAGVIAGSLSLAFTKISALLMLGNFGFSGVFGIVIDMLSVVLFAVCTRKATGKSGLSARSPLAYSVFVALLMAAACKLSIFYLSFGRIAAVVFCGYALGQKNSEQKSTLTIIACSFGVVLAEPEFSFSALGLVVASLICKFFITKDKWKRAALYTALLTGTAMLGLNHVYTATFLCEIAAGCFIYTLLPQKVSAVNTVQSEADAMVSYISDALHSFTVQIKKIKNSVAGFMPRADPSLIQKTFASAVEKTCYCCPSANKCWNECYSDSLDSLRKVSHSLLKNSRAEPHEIEGKLRDSCIALPDLCKTITDEYRKQLLIKKEAASDAAKLESICHQISIIEDTMTSFRNRIESYSSRDTSLFSDIVEFCSRLGTSAESVLYAPGTDSSLIIVFSEAPCQKALCSISRFLTKRFGATFSYEKAYGHGENSAEFFKKPPLKVNIANLDIPIDGRICGDVCSHFVLPGRRSCIVLSDGMGVGDAAHRHASFCCDTIESLMNCGFAGKSAILSSGWLHSSSSNCEFASTIDLFVIDPYCGNMEILKAGAAPTYLYSGGSFKKINAAGLPVGILNNNSIYETNTRVEAGDFAIIMSDGADSISRDILHAAAAVSRGSAEEICCSIKNAIAEKVLNDDSTVVVVKISENS